MVRTWKHPLAPTPSPPSAARTAASADVSRAHRQLDELRRLCAAGAVSRAVDLAHQHCAEHGADDEVLALLAGAIAAFGASGEVRDRYAEIVSGGR